MCSLLTFATFCKTFFRTLTDNVTAYVRVQGVRVSLCHFQQSPCNFTRGFLHALSIFRCLRAVSIIRRFQSWSLTRCFRYTHIPYPYKRLYPPFPLHAHSVYPKIMGLQPPAPGSYAYGQKSVVANELATSWQLPRPGEVTGKRV